MLKGAGMLAGMLINGAGMLAGMLIDSKCHINRIGPIVIQPTFATWQVGRKNIDIFKEFEAFCTGFNCCYSIV